MLKKAVDGHLGGRMSRIRPRMRWLEDVVQDLRRLGVSELRRKTGRFLPPLRRYSPGPRASSTKALH